MSLKTKLESGKFAITCEVGPLKGTDIHEVEENAELLKGKVDAANVTDQQSSVMRLSGLVTASVLVGKGLEPIFQMTCRDRNRIALQSDLLGAWVLGIRNVLALTGDLPSLGDHPEAKQVFDLDSVTLLQVIKRLNEGFDMKGNELKGKTDFFAGAVVKVESNTEASSELRQAREEGGRRRKIYPDPGRLRAGALRLLYEACREIQGAGAGGRDSAEERGYG
ncbi:MAG: methylenetetrahydrofolate reductase [Dehalococcoidales bacterium]